MTIYVLRHAIAEARRPGRPDAMRALTPAGRRKVSAVLRCARHAGVSPVVILTSPFRRAKQTAAIAAKILACRKVVVTRTLLPSGSPGDLWKEVLRTEAPAVLIAGHEPLLSRFVAFSLNSPAFQLDFKKGALVRLNLSQSGAHPAGVFQWMLTPKLAGA